MFVVLLLPCLALALAAAGVLYQVMGARRDRLRFTGEGRWVDVGDGCRLYVVEQGAGGPTVVFESGIAATTLNWRHMQRAVSAFTHTVSYDRGGLGWSSAAGSQRTPGNLAHELHAMLQQGGIAPPYVLVGHSYGGLVVRRYALLYPEDVWSVLLIDPMRCEEWPPMNIAKQATIDRGQRLTKYAVPVARLGLARLAVTSLLCGSGKRMAMLSRVAGDGVRHVLGRIESEVAKMPVEVRPAVAAHWSRPAFYAGMNAHIRAVPAAAREMQDAGAIRDIPVLLLTPGSAAPLSEESLRCIGDDVNQVIAEASGHWIHLDEPELVVESIRTMVLAARLDAETMAARVAVVPR